MESTKPLAHQEAGTTPPTEFRRRIGLVDSVMVVAGIMVGSGIFIVSAGDFTAGWQRRLAAGGMGNYRRSYIRWRAIVWRTGRDVARSWRPCMSIARSLFAAPGFPLRLDAADGHSDGHHRRSRHRLRAFQRHTLSIHS